jgi:hypothetical protein
VLAAALALTSPAVARIDEPPVAAEQPRRALRVLVDRRCEPEPETLPG